MHKNLETFFTSIFKRRFREVLIIFTKTYSREQKVARFCSWKYAKVFIIFKQTDVIQMIAFPISIKETKKYKIDMVYHLSPLFLNCYNRHGKLMTTDDNWQ